MFALVQQSHTKNLKIDSSALFGRMLSDTGAEYILVLYDPEGEYKFRSAHQMAESGIYDTAFNDYLQRFAESEIRENVLHELPGDVVDQRFGGMPGGDHGLVRFVFSPICSQAGRLGLVVLGFTKAFPRAIVPLESLNSLAEFLSDERQLIAVEKDKIFKLSKSLIAVQEPKQLGEILKYQINPILNLLSSGIICAKDGRSSSEYRFYYNYSEFPRDSSPDLPAFSPHILSAEHHSYLFDVLYRSKDSEPFFTLEYDRYAVKEEMHPFFSAYKGQGFRHARIVSLLRGTETVGFWVMIFNKGGDITDIPKDILDMVVTQVATTVQCINTVSQLADAKKENDVLQLLNIDLAATRDKRNLLKLIRSRLLNLFKFSHHFIAKINDDQMTISQMLLDSQSSSQYHPSYSAVTNMKAHIADGVLNKVLISSEPMIFDLEKLNERDQMPLYLQVNYESGIKKVVMLALRVDSRVMGIWCIAFAGDQAILPKYLELIKAAAAPISIAVANIRINDSLLDRENERNKLMDLSFDLTTIRNRKELADVIEPYLRKLFVFKDLSIFVDEDDYESRPFIHICQDEARGTVISDAESADNAAQEWTGLREYIRIFVHNAVSVSEIDKLIDKAGQVPFLISEYKKGARTAVVTTLRNDNRRIGVLNIFLGEGMEFNDLQVNLFKEVSFQIAKAVSNILFNEEIARRDHEKELLLALSEDIAAVRDKDQLNRVIDERLKPVLRFTHISLSMKAPDQHVVSFLTDPNSKARGHAEYHKLLRQDISMCPEFVDFIDRSPFPVILTPEQNHGFADIPKFLTVNFESGIREIVIAKLFDGISVFGYWVLCFNFRQAVKPHQFGFLQAIANQFSTAIYNIRANQEIADREKEKELLLSLSNHTAGLRNYRQLMELVSLKLKSVFKFETCFIGILNDETDSFSILLPESEAGKQHHFQETESGILDPELFKAISGSNEPLCIARKTASEVLWTSIRPESGLRKAVVTKFMHDSHLLAIWVMFYEDESGVDTGLFGLLKGIGDQLSVAVANIAINERQAEDDAQKGMLLSLSTKISSARNPSDLLSVLAAELKQVLRFSHGSIVLFDNKEKTFALPWVLPSESKSSAHEKYKDITSLTPVYDGVADLALNSDHPLFIHIDAFPEEKRPLYMKVSYECGMSDVVFVKLVINNEILGFWVIWYDIPPPATRAYRTTIEEIAKVLAVPIFNISFNEKINKREQEKTNLLDFTNAVAGVKDKFELRKIFNHYLRNLCLIEDLCLHWFTDDKKSQFCYFWNESGQYRHEADFDTIISTFYSTDDTVFKRVIKEMGAVNFNIKEMLDEADAPVYLKFLSVPGSDHVIGVPLFKGQEIVGVLFVKEFDANSADQPLFKGLCAQLAIAVSDLIATERVHQQLAEINQYKDRLEEEKIYLKQELETTHHYSEIIGDSQQIKQVFHKVSQVSASDSTVLILGETGTGKELIARAIHNNSPRKSKLMVKVNCAALPANLIESELFGHERGSFTGATEKRVGKFELASGGSLFLDEIGELPLELQVKLLRALQEREIERVGGKGTIKVDVRIIVATNRNLEQEVTEGRFRTDLYFRLSTFPILLPSLKERKEDIPLLASHFVNRFAKKTGKAIDTINNRAMQELVAYNWPGNVRELEHQIERSVLITTGNTIKSVELPSCTQVLQQPAKTEEVIVRQTIDENERDFIIRTLKQCNGKISGPKGAAAILGVPSTTLNSKIKRLGIKKNFLR